MKIRKQIEIDAGHRVPMHGSKCRSPHGHRYMFEIEVDGTIPEDGMVKDFAILKDVLVRHVDEPMDHAMILQQGDDNFLAWYFRSNGWKIYTVPFPPTAEHLAAHVAERIAPDLEAEGVRLTKVTCRETPTSFAVWEA